MKRTTRTKTKDTAKSIALCQEKIACLKDGELPTFKCVDCNTLQCEACKTELHKDGEYFFHQLVPLLVSLPVSLSSSTSKSTLVQVPNTSATRSDLESTYTKDGHAILITEEGGLLVQSGSSAEATSPYSCSVAKQTEGTRKNLLENIVTKQEPTDIEVRSTTSDSLPRKESKERQLLCEPLALIDVPRIEGPDTDSDREEFHSLSLDSILSAEVEPEDMKGSSKKSRKKANPTKIDDQILPSSNNQIESDEINVDAQAEYFSTSDNFSQVKLNDVESEDSRDDGDEDLITGLMQSMSESQLNSTLQESRDVHSQQAKTAIKSEGAFTAPQPGSTSRSKPSSKPVSKVNSSQKDASSSSFLLIDDKENVQVDNGEDLLRRLNCNSGDKVKVVSIFGNTGDGKSFTMNQVFFKGNEVFATSADQDTCTVGVWAAHDPTSKTLCIDTEGLLGITSNQHKRTRLLLKVLAVSDIVIYRTCADRLHTDLFQFLNDASVSYTKYFKKELEAVTTRNGSIGYKIQDLGPCVIVFHETSRTNTLNCSSDGKSAAEILRERAAGLECDLSAFSSVHYVGTKTSKPPTNFDGIIKRVREEIHNCTVRSPRSPLVILDMLKILNIKFNGEMYSSSPNSFPDEFFTCAAQCLACHGRCCLSMSHGGNHTCPTDCKYIHVYDNKVYICKRCFIKGYRNVVVPKTCSSTDNSIMGVAKYAWAGYVLECQHCGIIYRSRQHWYGNTDPTQHEVQIEIRHIWPGQAAMLTGTHNAARKFLDGVKVVADTVGTYSSKPARLLSDWVADQVAPPYWVPNNQIQDCYSCHKQFGDQEKKHHCRACGQGFCDECTQFTKPVPERGWGPNPVRVCEKCHSSRDSPVNLGNHDNDTTKLIPRQVVENVQSVLGAVASVAIDYPIEVIKDSARPSYWVPDHLIKSCYVCDEEFGPKLTIHHCRACGNGVCSNCSGKYKPVPSRGWDTPVRVCNTCYRKDISL